MADDDKDPFAKYRNQSPGAATKRRGEEDDPFAKYVTPKEDDQASALSTTAKPATTWWPTYKEMSKESVQQLGRGVQQLSPSDAPLSQRFYGVGNVAAGTLGTVFAPLSAAYRTFAGQPVEDVTRPFIPPTPVNPRGGIPTEWTEFGLGLATPFPAAPPRAPRMPPPIPYRPLDVTLSAGQEARDLSLIQREQAALRGQSGPPAQGVAKRFMEQQEEELARARQNITEAFDPDAAMGMQPGSSGAQITAESPFEAANIAQRGLQERAQAARAGVQASYQEAKAAGGEIHAGAFEGMPQRIKRDLSLGADPVIVDPQLTPWASAMIDDLDRLVGNLRIPSKADPFGAPNPERITGVNLEGVDQWRKRLSTFRDNAFGSGNARDG